ncbi:sugar ABC transporter ATP-binding protein [Arundinibacter roseus]|uniref:Sugar ABC transporter ATP-binding protein n=1 Tax=Arundinibacter roseus TaxID=2070510 RepID=A0A4R4JXY2_9BACT|nr:sugar ABC transporter ATP-binding protein [Arundinibacter roseus]TDB59543.1 sugar ABC transporter ATP-binding protein [Arundinibacter roseus]
MLRIEHVSKTFPGVKALNKVSLEVHAGQVHAICGENGAGKSTLMNCLVGAVQPDEGQLYWENEPVSIRSFQQAARLGISIVYQELSIIDSLSVGENIFAGHPPLTRFGMIDFAEQNHQVRKMLVRLGMAALDPGQKTGLLSVAARQMIELGKALIVRPRLLILDEPTASLTDKESKVLFSIIREISQQGTAVVYISHRMPEIMQISDRITVLKDGSYQGTFPTNEITVDQLIQKMVGRALTTFQAKSHATSEVVLHVQNLSGKGFQNVSFEIKKGEIVGFAGLVGAGRTELALAIFGETPALSGTIELEGQPFLPQSPREAIQKGIAYVPQERKWLGLFMEKSIVENIASSQLEKGWYRKHIHEKNAQELCRNRAIRTPSVWQQVRKLSGGNQQKVVLAKWLNTRPELLIVDEPTHGVDVGAKAEIYELLKEQTKAGKSVMLISSELPELLALSDRVLVMYQGQIVKEITREQATEENLLHYASGRTDSISSP